MVSDGLNRNLIGSSHTCWMEAGSVLFVAAAVSRKLSIRYMVEMLMWYSS